MDKQHLKKINDGLLKTFIDAGERSIKLREIGLKKEIKPDNTPIQTPTSKPRGNNFDNYYDKSSFLELLECQLFG